jgi:hypothetical protein
VPKLIPLPTIELIEQSPASSFDPSAFGFVSRLRAEYPRGIWDAVGLWDEYAVHYFGEHAGPHHRPLSRAQLFRQLRSAGMRRFRAGAKDPTGKRPYLYRISSPGRPCKRRGRIADPRPLGVDAQRFSSDSWVVTK